VSTDDEIREHYARGEERDRLLSPFGQVEFARTCEILTRALPPAPAVVADVGGGPGRYALWLAEQGYTVHHRDLVELHIDELSADAADRGLEIDSRIADARDLDLPDASVDAVLLLGPIYHLPTRHDRVAALTEAARVVRPGGPIFAVAISRWAARLHGEVAERLGEEFTSMHEAVELVERTGRLMPLVEGSFSAYTHRPEELRDEVLAAGLELVDLVGVEGIAFALADLEERLGEPVLREIVFNAARALERVPELLGLSPHLLATARHH
jgi:2-polyprenyl-3-methyl-5-hydroxy-6-metoxy-1,4-benzoquinol methylase